MKSNARNKMGTADSIRIKATKGEVVIKYVDHIAVLYMKCGENRLNDSFLDAMNTALDQIERNKNAKALITTGDGEKFYSNGLDLPWIAETVNKQGVIASTEFGERLHHFYTRLLTYPMPTIAAINGHAYADGAILALCHDYRVMCTKRGYWCLNEVFLGFPFTPYLAELIRTKLPPDVALEASTMGRRYNGEQAEKCKIVREICDAEKLLETAMTLACDLTQATYERENMRTMKKVMYSHILREPRESEEASFALLGLNKNGARNQTYTSYTTHL